MSDWRQEIDQLKKRISKLEKELSEKQPIRVDRIEYRVDKLYVESISNGVLDLGVHFASDIQIAVPSSTGSIGAGTTASGSTDPDGADSSGIDSFAESGQTNGISAELEWIAQRLDALEAVVAEWEAWKSSVDERLCSLEKER